MPKLSVSLAGGAESTVYANADFRHSDLGATQTEVIDFSIPLSAVAVGDPIESKLMKLPEGAKVKGIEFQPTSIPGGSGATGVLNVGFTSNNTDRQASDDDAFIDGVALTGLTAGNTYIYAGNETSYLVDGWLNMTIGAGYKSDAPVTGVFIIHWDA